MSLRKITDEQFADGTTIDGDRLESVLQDMETLINDIPDGHLLNRWVPQCIHVGYLPLTPGADATLISDLSAVVAPKGPWLPICNNTVSTSVPVVITNKFRTKGTKLPYRQATPFYASYASQYFPGAASPTTSPDQVVWSISIALSKPCILDAINAVFLTDDTDYTNTFKYGGSAPTGRTPTDWVKDVQFHVSIDNPFSPEDQTTSSKLFHVREFSTQGHMMRQPLNVVPTNDMTPNLTEASGVTFNFHQSLAFESRDLKIPLPIDTRIRFSCILPLNTSATAAIDAPWFKRPFSFVPSLSLTLLEPLLA